MGVVMRVMIDTNILDRISEDDETRNELINRRDILLLVTAAQDQEVAAIPDTAKRECLQAILARLCRRIALPPPAQSSAQDAPLDEVIIAAAVAAGCNLLVSEDIEVLNKALAAGIRAMDWELFLGRVVWAPRRGQK